MDDRVDELVREWGERRPELDFSPFELISRLTRATHYVQSRLDEIAAAYGLSHTGDLDVLASLDRAGPPYERTPSQLAQMQLVTAGGMTVRLNRLQQAGLIDRRPNPNDGRGVLVRLTRMGREVIDDALPTVLEAQTGAMSVLDQSKQDLLATLLRELLVGLGDTPAFRPAVAVARHKT